MRSWIVRLSLLALTIGVTHPVSAGTLNDIFTFPHVHYTPAEFGGIHGEGKNGQYLGMGDLSVELRYIPDPEGGHPNGRSLIITGVIPELGITDDECEGNPSCPFVWIGIMMTHEPDIFPGPPGPGFLRFTYALDEAHPALGGLGGGTWDVRLPLQRVPAPAAGLLLGAGVLLLAMRMRRLT